MGEIKGITSGTGFSGLFSDETAIGDAGVAGHKYKPISRWTDQPYQLYREGDTEQTIDPDHIYLGLMAYHAEGIKEVEFFLNGGDGVKVTEQEINPYTNLPEYCVKINKADVINPVNSDPTSDNEFSNNMELRAIVRPNSGIPRMHQHDKDVVLGEDSSLLIGHFAGYSGGKGDYFFDKKSTPGEFSLLGTVLKSNEESALPNITVYMRPDGNDNNDGTKESPLKTTGGALEKIRDIAAEDSSRLITEDGTGNHYVDVSRSEIVLLAGTYDMLNFGADVSGQVGWSRVGGVDQTDPNNRRPLCKRGWFTIRGDSDVPRENVIFTLTDEQAQLADDQLARLEHRSDFSLLDQNRALNCFKIEHITILRPQTRIDQTAWGMRVKQQADSMVAGHTADSDLLWFHDIQMENESIGAIHTKGSFLKNERTPDQCVICSGTGTLTSKILGGDENTTGFTHLINVDVVKNDGDNLKQSGMALAVSCKGNNSAFGEFRRIWFDPNIPEQAPYTKFNGYYSAIRYNGNPILSSDDLDENGSRFYEPGTLQEYIRIQNLNSPAGVTLSWPKDPRNVQHPTDKSSPDISADDSSSSDVSTTGTVWQKINHENFLNVNLPWLEDSTSETNFNGSNYAYWGQKYQGNGTTEYFGDPQTQREPPEMTGMVLPKAFRKHIIQPNGASEWYFTDKSVTDALSIDEQVDLFTNTIGPEIYDPASEINLNGKFYEPIFCTMLKYEDSTMGVTAWGQILFDAREPIAANPDVEGWGTTQDFVFRLAGTTFPSAGHIQDVFDDDGDPIRLSQQFSTQWPYTKAQFQISPEKRVDRGQYNVAWAVGITAQGMSLEHKGTADRVEFGTTPILPENTHPISSWCNLGSRDTTHVDSIQWFATKRIDSVYRIENALFAYCNFLIDGQGGNFGGVTYMDAFQDVAFINNVWANIPIPGTLGLNYRPPSQRHNLWYHNTIHNLAHGNGISLTSTMSPTNPLTHRLIEIAERDDPRLFSIYGSSIEIPRENDALVYRNNFISKFAHDFQWVYRGTGQVYTDTDDTEKQGITWPYINNGETIPVRVERNFRWWGGPVNQNANSQSGIMNVLNENNPPKFKAMLPFSGGNPDGFSEGVVPPTSPNDLTPFGVSKFDGFRPEDDSPLVAGGTLGMELHVPFDMERKRRISHPTVGAYEVDSSYLTSDDEFVSQTTKFNDIEVDLIPSVTGSTLMSFALDFDKHERFYAKRIKVRATKTLEDGTESVLFSDNILRLQADRSNQQGIESGNSSTAEMRSLFLDTPEDVTYLFTPNNSTASPVTAYHSASSIDYEEIVASDDQYSDGVSGDFGLDLEFETVETSASQNITWLDTSYDISSIQIYGSNFQTPVGNRNKIKLFFGHVGETAGTGNATQFHTTYAAAGGTLAIPFPNGATYFVDKTAGGMTAHGSSLESYFYTTAPGTTVSLTSDLPSGEVVIEKPTGL